MNKLAFAVAVLAVATVSACSSEDTGTVEPAGNDVVNVQVTSNQFSPASLKIKVGQTVRWTWAGGSHNVVSGADCNTEDGNFTSGAPMAGGTFDHKFEKAGTFPYYCSPHCAMGMKGEVVVE